MNYPLGENAQDRVRSKTGKRPGDITLSAVLAGEVSSEDIKISQDVLHMQGQVALEAGKPQMAANFERAGELVDVPDDEILRIYNMLRPKRAGKTELLDLAEHLRRRYSAEQCAALIEQAAAVYEKRGLLR